jgi:four helix bundle protein
MALTEEIYRLSARFPKEELYGLTSQVRRAAVSIPSNIAEGQGRENSGSFIQFLRIAQGSLKEVETQLLLAVRIGLMTDEDVAPAMAMCDELGKMTRALIRSIQRKQTSE